MRDWFIIGCKLLGVYFLYWAFNSLLGAIGFIAIKGFYSNPTNREILVSSGIRFISEVCFAIPLLFKSEWLATALKLTGSLQNNIKQEKGIKIQSGIILLGIYIFCTNFGQLAYLFAASRRASGISDPIAATQPSGLSFSLDFVAPAVKLALSLILIFGAKYIETFLEGKHIKETEHQAPLARE